MTTRLSNVAPPAGGLATLFIPFGEVTKSTENGVDVRIVNGVMTDETLDLDGQIVDYDWAKQASAKWFKSWANIREQHTSNAVGKGVELGPRDDARAVDLGSRVIDPGAIRKLDEKILQGYSVGIKGARTIKDAKAPHGRIVGGEIVEVSLVDHPANENCKVVLAKAATSGRLEAVEQEVVEKGNAPGSTATSPVMGDLVADIEDGLNEQRTNPAGKQTALPADTAGEDLDTAPGSALRRKKKPSPELGGKPAGMGARETPKEAEGETEKGSIVPGQASPTASGAPAATGDVTSPTGADAGACPDNSCSCGGCGPSCTGDCCDACQMGDEYDRRETLHFGANAEYLKYLEGGIYKRDFSSADRKRLAGEGKAMPDGSFPIANEQDLHNAIRALGRASDPAAAKKHIKARAAAMGMSDALPDDWKTVTATTQKSSSPEEALEMSYANAAPHIKAALEAGDAKAALALMQAAEVIAKGSIIAAQAGGTDTSDGVDVVPEPATGRKKKTTPEQGGAGAADHAPDSEDEAPTKAADADITKAVLSEVSKAVATALKPLRDEIDELKKRAAPGGPSLTGLRQLSAPKDAQAELLKTTLGNMSLETLQDLSETYPDGQIRMGLKQILADVQKGV